MFVYRPHVQGAKDITTPDIALDMTLWSEVWSPPRSGPIGAALVLVAAHFAPLVTVGFLDQGTPWIIARGAWRLSDVTAGWSGISITFASTRGETPRNLSGLVPPEPASGRAVFVPVGSALTDPQWCRVTLTDATLARSITHTIQFSQHPESHR